MIPYGKNDELIWYTHAPDFMPLPWVGPFVFGRNGNFGPFPLFVMGSLAVFLIFCRNDQSWGNTPLLRFMHFFVFCWFMGCSMVGINTERILTFK
jgi:hypothetical protein